jgi:V-type H+-transporting ATPase subunit a
MGVFDRLPPMDHLRSEKMCYVQLIIPAECARIAVTYLGELGLLQFKDVSAPSLFLAASRGLGLSPGSA